MLCVPAFAQTDSTAKAPGERHARAEAGASEKGAGHGMMARTDVNQQMEKLTKELTLTQEQQTQIRKLMTDYQEQMREQMRKLMSENGEKLKALRKQIDEARAAGDREKLKTLEAQRRELTGEEKTAAARQKLITNIEAQLTADQKTKFEQIKDEVFPTGRRFSLQEHPEMLLKAVEAANVSQEKQQKIKSIVDEWKTKAKASGDRAAAKADATKAEAAKTAAAEVYKKVMAELTSEEQAKVNAWQPEPGARHEHGDKTDGKSESKARKSHKRAAAAETSGANQ
jgi:Spy/CpxP family protein refolding chaperone